MSNLCCSNAGQVRKSLTIKAHADGSTEWYKIHLVAFGFTHKHDVDYEETFTLVSNMTTVCTLFALVVIHQWLFYHMDVTNVFLHSDIFEEIYMAPPPAL